MRPRTRRAGRSFASVPAAPARLAPRRPPGAPIMGDMNDVPPLPAGVLVLQHLLEDGPGYLGQWLDA
jgi:hypothetical protein